MKSSIQLKMTRMLIPILPAIIVAMLLLSSMYKRDISAQIDTQMQTQLRQLSCATQDQLTAHAKVAEHLARTVEAAGGVMSKTQYVELVKRYVVTNPSTFGDGVFFHYYKYKPNVKFFGPYAYRKDGVITFINSYIDGDPEAEKLNYPTSDWYTCAKGIKTSVVWTKPYVDAPTKMLMVTSTAPFYDSKGRFMGVATGDMTLTELQKMVSDTKVGKTGSAFLITDDGSFLADRDSRKLLTAKLTDDPNKSLAQIGQTMLAGKNGQGRFDDGRNGASRIYYRTIEGPGWILALVMPEKELFAPVQALQSRMMLGSILLIAFIAAIVWFNSRAISSRVKRVTVVANEIADDHLGNHSLADLAKLDDELGELARAFERVQQNLGNMATLAGNIADGDLADIGEKLSQTGDLSSAFATMQENLRRLVIRIDEVAQQVASGSQELSATSDVATSAFVEIARNIQAVAAGAAEQSRVIEEALRVVGKVSDGTTQVSSEMQSQSETLAETRARVHKMSDAVEHVAANVETISSMVSNVIGGMQRIKATGSLTAERLLDLKGSSKQIGEIVAVIDSIAGQTNLLALNAAIESARAGEAGKGFAVVAEEVRRLAERTSKATDEIELLVKNVQDSTSAAVVAMEAETRELEEGTRLADSAGDALQEINSAVGKMSVDATEVSRAVDHMNDVSGRTSSVTAEMNSGMALVAERINNLAVAAQETSDSAAQVSGSTDLQTASAQELASSAEKMAKLAEELVLAISHFQIANCGNSGSLADDDRRRWKRAA